MKSAIHFNQSFQDMAWRLFSGQLFLSTRLQAKALLLLLFIGGCSVAFGQQLKTQANNDPTIHFDKQLYQITYTGTYRDFTIPADAAGKYIYLQARGGDGGTISYKDNLPPGKGGQGATVSGYFKVGSGANEVPVGATLRTIVGQSGSSYENHGQMYHHCGGGGGGTGVLFLPPNIEPQNSEAADWTMLLVAGGGGGGAAKLGVNSRDGLPGNDGKEGTGDKNSIKDICWMEGMISGLGGKSGGGTSYVLWSEICEDRSGDNFTIGDSERESEEGGLGGFQKANGKWQPTGAKGGDHNDLDNDGGFGFGSGGAGKNLHPGGGGGYAGGGRGDLSLIPIEAGGGGSYVNSAYAVPSTIAKIKNGTTSSSQNGFVKYYTTDIAPVFLAKGHEYKSDKVSLLKTGKCELVWQSDGNLVLYRGSTARWRSNTNGQGAKLVFQNDGNLVIYDTANQPLWATATADAQQGGNGGRYLMLLPDGNLTISRSTGESLWHTNAGLD